MKIRSGRKRSLIGGIMALIVMLVGVVLMTSVGGMRNVLWPFVLLWVLFCLVGAGAEFYNAFSRRGLPIYEIDADDEDGADF